MPSFCKQMIASALTFVIAATSVVGSTFTSPAYGNDELTGIALDRLQTALKNLGSQDRTELASLLQYVRIVVSNDDLVSLNPRVNGALISMLANATSTSDFSVRIQGGWLLANLTTKNNVCGIIDTLFKQDLDLKSRSNLLEIVSKLTTQLPSDVAGWLKIALDRNDGGYSDTRADAIKVALSSRLGLSDTLQTDSPGDFAVCLNLPMIGSTYVGGAADNAAYSVYIHQGKASDGEVLKVKTELAQAGFKVFDPDKDVDLAGTGVDYSLKGPNPSAAQIKAAAISGIVYQSINSTIGTRPQSATPIAAFGVWL